MAKGKSLLNLPPEKILAHIATVANDIGVIAEYEYDILGRLIWQKDATGMETVRVYDYLGNLTETIEDYGNLNRSTYYGYDRAGRLISIASSQQQTDYTLDYMGNIVKTDYPTTKQIDWIRDFRGNVVCKSVWENAQLDSRIHYKRDNLGRIRSKQEGFWDDWSEPNSIAPFDEYCYDAAGNKRIVSNIFGANDTELSFRSYDGLGNLVYCSEMYDGFMSETVYNYDQRGLLTKIIYPTEKEVKYSRDGIGRIEKTYYDGNLVADYQWLGQTFIKKHLPQAGITQTRDIDNIGRIMAEKFYNSGEPVAFKSITYTYGGSSNRLASRDNTDYYYDGLNKLTAEGAKSYTSDILGNPTNAASDGLTYTTDAEDRIVEVSDGLASVATYDYDRFGRRVRKTAGGVETYYVYDIMGNVITEYEKDGENYAWTKVVVYGADNEALALQQPRTAAMNAAFDSLVSFAGAWLCDPNCPQGLLVWDTTGDDYIDYLDYADNIATFEGAFSSNILYLLTDKNRSVIATSNGAEISYNAWGEVSFTGNIDGLNILWNGYYFDGETGNYYLKNRYYSPVERQFLTEDPHGIIPDENWNNPFGITNQYTDGVGLTVYAGFNPVNNRDDWGLKCQFEIGCSPIEEGDEWWRPILRRIAIPHCDLRDRGTSSPKERVYRVSRKVFSGKIGYGSGKGKKCRCADCADIKNCIAKVREAYPWGKAYPNCHTQTKAILKHCCLKSTWNPPIVAGPTP